MPKGYDPKAASLELVHSGAKLLCSEGYLDFNTCKSVDHALSVMSDKDKANLALDLLRIYMYRCLPPIMLSMTLLIVS